MQFSPSTNKPTSPSFFTRVTHWWTKARETWTFWSEQPPPDPHALNALNEKLLNAIIKSDINTVQQCLKAGASPMAQRNGQLAHQLAFELATHVSNNAFSHTRIRDSGYISHLLDSHLKQQWLKTLTEEHQKIIALKDALENKQHALVRRLLMEGVDPEATVEMRAPPRADRFYAPIERATEEQRKFVTAVLVERQKKMLWKSVGDREEKQGKEESQAVTSGLSSKKKRL